MVAYLRRVLKLDKGPGAGESVFLYVNSCFAPSLDEVVGNLHKVSCPFFIMQVCGWARGRCIDANLWDSALRILRTSLLLPTP